MASLWARWRLKSPTSRSFAPSFVQAQIKETSKLRVTGPLWGESTGDRAIPHTKGQLHGKYFQLMTSHDTTEDIQDTTRTPVFAYTQRTREAIITALIRQNDVAVSFWRKNDVIIAWCARCVFVYYGRNRVSSDKMSTWFIREWFDITLKDECHLSSSTPVVITFVN